MGSLEEGASNAANICMGIKKNDRVLIVTDKATHEVANAIYRSAKEITSDTSVFILEDYVKRPMEELPDKIIKALPNATVTFWIAQSLEGELPARSAFRREAVKYARHAHMPGVTRVMMEQGMCADYQDVYGTTMKIYEIVREVQSMHVTNDEGTSLKIEFNQDWKWIPSHGIFHNKGEWGNLPDGEVFTAPYKVNGTLVLSELGDWFAEKYGYLDNCLRFEINNSMIDMDSIDCPNTALKKDLLAYLKTDENSNRASEFAIPTNNFLIENPLIGNLLQDEKARVHIAFGDPYGSQTGAGWKSKTHVDCIIEKANVIADNVEIMREGKPVI